MERKEKEKARREEEKRVLEAKKRLQKEQEERDAAIAKSEELKREKEARIKRFRQEKQQAMDEILVKTREVQQKFLLDEDENSIKDSKPNANIKKRSSVDDDLWGMDDDDVQFNVSVRCFVLASQISQISQFDLTI